MDFALSGEQQAFAASLHDILARAGGPDSARSWANGDRKPGLEIWRSLADAGVTGLMVAPEYGGLGASPVDLVVACEEIGHHAVPGPVAESAAAVPQLLASSHLSWVTASSAPGSNGFVHTETMTGEPAYGASPGHWLRELGQGGLIATVAAPPLVPFAPDADISGLVLLAEPDCVRLGVPGHIHHSVDPARTLAEVTAGVVIAAGPAVRPALALAVEFGTLACSAMLLGLGRFLLEETARFSRQRIQFGQPVGSFQAVKHHLADVLIGLEFARPLVFGAAISLAAGSADAARDVSAAKVASSAAASRAAGTALQIHGAIGYTAEHDISCYLTKVQALAPAWGSQAYHRARVLAALTGSGT